MDSNELRLAARGLDIVSADLASVARRLAGDLDALTWSGFAGDRWRSAVQAVIDQALHCCGSLDRIASELKL